MNKAPTKAEREHTTSEQFFLTVTKERQWLKTKH